MIKTILLVAALTLNSEGEEVSIFTNTRCGVACVDVETSKAKIMVFNQEGYIKMSVYINRGLNKINTSNLDPGDYYIVAYVDDVYVAKDIFTITGNRNN
ncbi:hypothetical protein OAA15_00745 [bacterium]|nr:hypothetical protein [bacterium]